MSKRPFDFIPLPAGRSTRKPRGTGLTMMVDWGLGLRRLEDALALCGDYLDLGKIAVGTPRLYDEGLLREKFAIYQARQIRPFLGGMFIEHYLAAHGMDAMNRFYEEAKRVGFAIIEVSDNLTPFTAEQRQGLIHLAREHGLAVFGEVGSKWEVTDVAIMIQQAQECFEAGAELVLVEGAEFVDEQGEPKRALLKELAAGVDMSRVLFELPGPWISGVTLHLIHDLKKFFIREFGPDVNIANVMPDDVIETEALRCGLSVISLGSAH
jgi:phosphosulfolactate synthase